MREPDTWKQVRGPISAAIQSACRLGWRPRQTPGVFTDQQGDIFDLKGDCPKSVQTLALAAAEIRLLNRARRARLKWNEPAAPPDLIIVRAVCVQGATS